MNNISSHLINEIKRQIKNNINNTLLTKINSFIKQCDLINNQIQIKLNKIKINILPNEMNTLVQLLNTYSILLQSQNNSYSFNIGKKPLDILNIFISQQLEPPLSLILIKYNLIEEELLNKTQSLADEFPDCYSEVKRNLLGNKINIIEDLTSSISPTLFDYQNILVNEIKGYINKLIHFVYIDGIKTREQSCEESDCAISNNIFRRLNKKEIKNISNVYKGKGHHNLINKKIYKRKILSLPEFNSDSGAFTESDIVYYLSELQNTIINLDKLYLGEEYLNINNITDKFLERINITYLEQLRLSFDLKLVKFSTILSEKNMDKLKDIILKQFYLIEDYVHNSSDLIKYKINIFLTELNKTSEFIQGLSDFIHNQVLGYYNILYRTILSKYKKLDDESSLSFVHSIKINEIKKAVSKAFDIFHLEIQNNYNLNDILVKAINASTIGGLIEKMNDYNKLEKSIEETFIIPFPSFPNLQIRATLGAFALMGFYTSIEPNWYNLNFKINLDIYSQAKVHLKLEGGFYSPASLDAPIVLAFVLGLNGTIGDGRAGLKLDISLFKNDITYEVYYTINLVVFEFYYKIKLEINQTLFDYKDESDIFRKRLEGINDEFNCMVKVPKQEKKKNWAFDINSIFGI